MWSRLTKGCERVPVSGSSLSPTVPAAVAAATACESAPTGPSASSACACTHKQKWFMRMHQAY